MNTTFAEPDTKRNILPYRFNKLPNGKIAIVNTRNQTLIVSQAEVFNILKKPDLDTHRRRMYEAALKEFGE